MKYNEYVKLKKDIQIYSEEEWNEFVKLENLINLCDNNSYLKNYLINLKGTSYDIYYCKGMEWDVDLFTDHWSTDMEPTFLYYDSMYEWERYIFDEDGNNISLGDGFIPNELTEEWYNIIKKGIDKVKLDNGNYVIAGYGNEYFIMEGDKRNKELFKNYLNQYNEKDDYVSDIYTDKELNHFYHNRPHNLPV